MKYLDRETLVLAAFFILSWITFILLLEEVKKRERIAVETCYEMHGTIEYEKIGGRLYCKAPDSYKVIV